MFECQQEISIHNLHCAKPMDGTENKTTIYVKALPCMAIITHISTLLETPFYHVMLAGLRTSTQAIILNTK